MFYKANLDETVGRLSEFWMRRMPDRITAVIRGFPNPHFERYLTTQTFEPEGTPALDVPDDERRWAYWDARLRIMAEVGDDSLPVAYPTLDFGESLIAALLDARIEYFWRGDGSTYSALLEPLVSGEHGVGRVCFDTDSPLMERVRVVTRGAQERARGVCGICPFITMDGLNFACEVMGTTEAYTQVAYGGTETIHQLMEFAVDMNIRFLEIQQSLIDDFAGGAFHWQAHWVPFKGATPWLSVDSYTCCSPQTYAQAGLAYQQRLIDHFGQGVMHFHTSRIDLLLEVLQLKNLVGLSIDGSGRPQDPKPFEVLMTNLGEIRRVAGDMPLMCPCTESDLLTHMQDGTLPGNVRYNVSDVATIGDANQLMDRVKTYRALR